MKLNIMLLTMCWLSIFACKTQKEKSEVTSTKEEQTMSKPQNEVPTLTGTWSLARIKDNYDGVWKDASDNKKTIILTAEGGYQEDNDGNKDCRGQFTKKENTISVTNTCNRAVLTYRVDELTSDKLVLAIQGRHGDVLYEYSKSR